MTDEIPPERKRQFDLIEAASKALLRWAHAEGILVVYTYPVVPFVETDFSLAMWIFVDTESRISEYKANGVSDSLASQFFAELTSAGYPQLWLSQVSFHFGSKEVVDRDFKGSFYYFLR